MCWFEHASYVSFLDVTTTRKEEIRQGDKGSSNSDDDIRFKTRVGRSSPGASGSAFAMSSYWMKTNNLENDWQGNGAVRRCRVARLRITKELDDTGQPVNSSTRMARGYLLGRHVPGYVPYQRDSRVESRRRYGAAPRLPWAPVGVAPLPAYHPPPPDDVRYFPPSRLVIRVRVLATEIEHDLGPALPGPVGSEALQSR